MNLEKYIWQLYQNGWSKDKIKAQINFVSISTGAYDFLDKLFQN